MKTARSALRFGAATLLLGILGCSGSPSEKAQIAQEVAVTVAPESAGLTPAAQQAFTAAVTGTIDQSVTWAVVEGTAGGAVTANGIYTAPQATGTYHVVVTSNADPTKSAVAVITVTAAPTVTVAVTPKTAALATGASQTFSCSVTGSSDTACTWSVQEGASAGTVSSAGLYTAPQSAGTYHLVATSHADPTKTDTATITVTAAPPPVAVGVAPKTAAIATGASQAFTCSVTGSSDTRCTWSVQEGASGGTVTSGGVYTAPQSSGTYHVVATSRADTTKTDVATVTVTAPPPTVTVAVAPSSATVAAGASRTFTCSVTGSSDTACTWSVQEGASGGTVTAAGVYTAPQSAGTYHVVARSHADSTKSAAATVTVTAPPPAVAVAISPTTAAVDACQTFTFSATVTGTSNTAVTWSVSEGASGGSVSASGVYTAPSAGGTYHVVAASQADPTKSQSATVTVTERILSVAVTPSSTTVATGGAVQFTATVTTTCGAFTQTQAVAAPN